MSATQMKPDAKHAGKLEGKVALITGGNSGIGLATAKQFMNEGAYVFITGRREAELAAAKKQIGKNVTAIQGDVSNLDDLDRWSENPQAASSQAALVLVLHTLSGAPLVVKASVTPASSPCVYLSRCVASPLTQNRREPIGESVPIRR